jgi:hypothetical protein
MRTRLRLLAALAGALCVSCTSSGPETIMMPTVPAPAPAPPPAPRALESATIMITPNGFLLDSAAAAFRIDELRVYQGGALTFVNQDNVPHDILSDPPHRHTDCPEFDAAGFIVPGQSRATQPLLRLVTCGFHDHLREGDIRFSGRVSVEPR